MKRSFEQRAHEIIVRLDPEHSERSPKRQQQDVAWVCGSLLTVREETLEEAIRACEATSYDTSNLSVRGSSTDSISAIRALKDKS